MEERIRDIQITECPQQSQELATLFSFPPQDEKMEQLIQRVYEQMAAEVADKRARTLIQTRLTNYREAEPFINDPSLMQQFHGVGQLTVARAWHFLKEFCDTYLSRAESMAEADSISADYPFLSAEEQGFVITFRRTHGRYPVWFIALCYYRRATDRFSRIFARVNGLLGRYESLQSLAEEVGVSSERVRQLSKPKPTDRPDVPPVWSRERWAATPCYQLPLLTEASTQWADLCRLERLGDLDFYSGLCILSKVRPVGVVAMMVDGSTANMGREKGDPWQTPEVLFAYDLRLSDFRFSGFLKKLGHEAALQRVVDKVLSLKDLAQEFFRPETSEETRAEVYSIIKEVAPMLAYICVEGDNVILQRNRINYVQDIYDILHRHGEAMTVEDIFTEFRLLHPEDHHTDSTFIRSYMLVDDRFEAVGRKSTYQLREWQRFSGSLGDLAVVTLQGSPEPLTQEQLCQKMLEVRGKTTLKSCASSIYLAVMDGRLKYLMTDEDTTPTAFVGLAGRDYHERYWHSTLTVDGVLDSMHRFIAEKGRWPFIANKEGMEGALYYSLRKFTHKFHVTEEEYTRYHRGMADIPSYVYPHNERQLTFIARCKALLDFRQQHHRLPQGEEEPQLMKWYRDTHRKQHELDELRKYYFSQITKTRTRKAGQQLALIFDDADI